VSDKVLDAITAESEDYGDLLRGRYWQKKTVIAMVAAQRPYIMSERSFFTLQKEAIERFATLLNEHLYEYSDVTDHDDEADHAVDEVEHFHGEETALPPTEQRPSLLRPWLFAGLFGLAIFVVVAILASSFYNATPSEPTQPEPILPEATRLESITPESAGLESNTSKLDVETVPAHFPELDLETITCFIDARIALPETIACSEGRLLVTVTSNEDTGYPEWDRKMVEFITQVDLAPTVTARARIERFGPRDVYDTLETAGWITLYGQNHMDDAYPIEDEITGELMYIAPENMTQAVELAFPQSASGSLVATICEHSDCSGQVINFEYIDD